MKKYLFHFTKFSLIILFLYFIYFALLTSKTDENRKKGDSSIDYEKWTNIIKKTREVLNSRHYNAPEIDDEFSLTVYKKILDGFDPNKLFFTRDDIKLLSQYKYQLDDFYLNANFTFIQLINSILSKNIKEISLSTNLFNKNFNFNQIEYFETDTKKRSYLPSKKSINQLWKKKFKFEIINSVLQLQSLEENKDKSFSQLVKKAKTIVQSKYNTFFNDIINFTLEDRITTYFNIILSVYDPHTVYFSPEKDEDFNINISGQLEGIGARLSKKDNVIKVDSLVNGGPAWKQGELESGDEIEEVISLPGEKPIDIRHLSLSKAVRYIRGKKGTKVTLKVKKATGINASITIVRDRVVLEESYAKSAIIEKNNRTVGYIKLPSFYFHPKGGKYGRRCDSDIYKELQSLMSKNIDGLIFDLRYNGGGSLESAINIIGYFIEQGPVVQVSRRMSTYAGLSSTIENKPLKNPNSTLVYDGSLVIMVNDFSASASEIVSSALQDYNRAIILGTGKTHGKGTIQNLEPLLQQGSLKYTMGKFFRINGDTTQKKGVIPDISLPEIIDNDGEESLDTALNPTIIKRAEYQKWLGNAYILDEIKIQSKQRVKTNRFFNNLKLRARILEDRRNKSKVNLKFNDYKKETKLFEKQLNDIDSLTNQELIKRMSPIFLETQNQRLNEAISKSRTKWVNNLKKDAYLEEALHVLMDMN